MTGRIGALQIDSDRISISPLKHDRTVSIALFVQLPGVLILSEKPDRREHSP